MEFSILRPGLLVSLNTTIKGNVKYKAETIESPHIVEEGAKREKWETTKTVYDPAEHDRATKARSKCRSIVSSVCAWSSHGLLCLERRESELKAAIIEARKVADEFNATARLSRVYVNVIVGKIAADDVEAVRAINSEVRDLMQTMESGLRNLDVQTVRDAANRARSLGSMLTPAAAERVQIALDTARAAARKIKKAAAQGAAEVDRLAIAKITEARTAFLDIDSPAGDIEAPTGEVRALDFEPEESAPVVKAAPAATLPAFDF